MPNTNIAIAASALLATGAAPPIYTVTDRITGADGGWDLAAVDSASQRLYVARRAGVMAVDLRSRKVTDTLVPLKGGHGVLPIPGTNRVIATAGAAGTATIFEGATGQIIAELQTGKNPDAIAYDPATRTVWVFNPGSGDAAVIDPLMAKIVANVPIGGALEMGVADGAGRLYVNVEDKNQIAVIDTRARKVVTRFALAGCDGPTGIAYATKAKLLVSACGNGVAKITSVNGRDLGGVPIGRRPDGAAFDDQRQLALVPSGADGTLSIFRLTPKPALVETVQTRKSARTIALDSANGAAYLPAANYAPPVPGVLPTALPGTFVVLVVKPTATAR